MSAEDELLRLIKECKVDLVDTLQDIGLEISGLRLDVQKATDHFHAIADELKRIANQF